MVKIVLSVSMASIATKMASARRTLYVQSLEAQKIAMAMVSVCKRAMLPFASVMKASLTMDLTSVQGALIH